ncbi:MAG: PDZ domain-containing protein [Chloroflexi bacterium]|nr:PDZ domain-containing protein [Chloroflexota bacterium]
MSTRGAILLAIGMLILGLSIGAMTGGVTGFFLGQSSRATAGQFFQQGYPQGRFPNQQGQAQPTPTPQPAPQQQPNQTNPFNRRGFGNLPPAANVLNGARVTQVVGNSPAAKAGLKVGDIITAVGTTKLDADHALADLIQAHKPGEKVDLSVTRGSQTMIITVELGPSSNDSNKAYLGIEYSVMPGAQFRFPNG